MYWCLIGVIFLIEFLALLFKIYTAAMDQAALRQREVLLDACVAHSIGITSAEFMHQVGREFKRDEACLKQARDVYAIDVKSSMAGNAAIRRAKATYDQLVADLAKETIEHGEEVP